VIERQAANLLFALVSRRYERGSIIVTSNCGFEQWGEILGDAMVAAALTTGGQQDAAAWFGHWCLNGA
jgi:DNA replication protein DnaC